MDVHRIIFVDVQVICDSVGSLSRCRAVGEHSPEGVVYLMGCLRGTDEAVTTEVNDRVTLVLAAIAQTLVVTRADWASSVVLRLEQRLSVHGE